MSRNPEFMQLLERMKEIHERKSHDYAQNDNVFSNFERSAVIASWFNDETDKVFTSLIGVKLTRLAELLNGKEAKNESVEDSFLDLATYCAIWGSRYMKRKVEVIVCPKCEHIDAKHKYSESGIDYICTVEGCECKR